MTTIMLPKQIYAKQKRLPLASQWSSDLNLPSLDYNTKAQTIEKPCHVLRDNNVPKLPFSLIVTETNVIAACTHTNNTGVLQH